MFYGLLLLVVSCAVVQAETKSSHCEAQKSAIRRQMRNAEKQGDAHELARLDRALSNVLRRCGDPALRRSKRGDAGYGAGEARKGGAPVERDDAPAG